MSTCNAKETAMVTDNGSAEFGNVVFEVHQILALFMCCHIIKMNVLVSPFEVVDDSFVRQLLFYDEDALKEIDDTLFDVEMVKFSYHSLLILEVAFVLVNQGVSFVNDISDVIEDGTVCAHVQGCKFVGHVLVFFFFALKFIMHVFNLNVVSFELTDNKFLI